MKNLIAIATIAIASITTANATGADLYNPQDKFQGVANIMYIGSSMERQLPTGPINTPVDQYTTKDVTAPEACQARFQSDWDALKLSATNTLVPNQRHEMDAVHFKFVTFVMQQDDADTIYKQKLVKFDVKMCAMPQYQVIGIMSHELGHMTSIYRNPSIDFTKYTNIAYDEKTMEAFADQYGAQILRQAQLDDGQFLAMTEDMCSKGSSYSCTRAGNWKAGLTY